MKFRSLQYLLVFPAALAIALSACHAAADDGGPHQTNATAHCLAVVFRNVNSVHNYVGTSPTPRLPSRLFSGAMASGSAAFLRGKADGYEVWVLSDGKTQGLWYSPGAELYGKIEGNKWLGNGFHDDGSIRQLLRTAIPPHIAIAAKGDWSESASFTFLPQTLSELCRVAPVIATGRVVGILRNDHVPDTAPYEIQQTVFVFAVERYLRAGTGSPPLILKVRQYGGALPWRSENGRFTGIGYELDNEPLLNVGDRYCLFLGLPEDPTGFYHRTGHYSAEVGDYSGRSGELDEYVFPGHYRGKLLLRGGRSLTACHTGQPEKDEWQFAEGPQIVGVTESAALGAIIHVLTPGSR